MTNKNPYENQDTVDIPDFVEDKDKETTSVDMSIFNMKDSDLYDDDDHDEDDQEETSTGRRLNVPVVVMACLIVLLLVGMIASIIYGTKQHKLYVEAENNYQAAITKTNTLQTNFDLKNSEFEKLKIEYEEYKKTHTSTNTSTEESESSSSSSSSNVQGNYIVVSTEGLNLRKSASTSSDIAASLDYNDVFYGVSETTNADGSVWIETYEGYFACMKTKDGTVLVKSK